MALAFAHIGDASQGGGASAAVTLSRALAAGELGLCAVLNSHASAPATPTVSGGGVTWVQVHTVLMTATTRLTIFRAQGSAPSGTALTVDYGGATQSGTLVIVDAVTGTKSDIGNNGAGAVQQVVQGSFATTADYTVTGAALSNGSNAQWTMFGIAGSQNTPTAQDGATLLNARTKGSPANAAGTTYEIGDNHARVTLTSTSILGILLEIAVPGLLFASLGGSITPFGTVRWYTVKWVLGYITPTGTLTRTASLKKALAGAITPVGTLGRRLKRTLAGAITPVGTLTRIASNAYYVVMAGAITPVGTLIKSFGFTRLLGGGIAPVGTLVPKWLGTYTRTFAGAISPSGTLAVKWLGTYFVVLSGAITPFGTLASRLHRFLLSVTGPATVPMTPSMPSSATLTPTSDQTAILTPTDEIEG